jgi:hypothetical protein
MVSFTPRLLYPEGKSPLYGLDRRLGGPQSRSGHGVEEKNSHLPQGIELRSSDRPARSQSLYRLSYPGSLLYPCTVLFNLILSSQHSDQATDWSTGVGFPAGAGTFLSSLPLWGPTQPLIQRVSGAVTLVVMRLGHGTDHSPLSSEVVKNPWSYICSAPYVIMLLC